MVPLFPTDADGTVPDFVDPDTIHIENPHDDDDDHHHHPSSIRIAEQEVVTVEYSSRELDDPFSGADRNDADEATSNSSGVEEGRESDRIGSMALPLPKGNSDSNNKVSDTQNDSTNHQDDSEPVAVSSSSSSSTSFGGVVAAGLGSWVQRQRERRRQHYLQHQAERQLRKIAEAESSIADPAQRCSLEQSTTFSSILKSSSSSSLQEGNGQDQNGGGGPRLKVVGSPVVSTSGEGMSGHLDISGILDEDEDDDDDSWMPNVRVEEEPTSGSRGNESTSTSLSSSPFILTPEQMQQIALHVLPPTISSCRWKRLYSLARDGDSFEACLRKVQDIPRTLLVLRTTRGAVLGGYADAPWNTQSQGNYYGSALACLFSVEVPTMTTTTMAKTTPTTERQQQHPPQQQQPPPLLHVYKWSGANRYIQLCDVAHKMLAFGGGGREGSFGLSVEADFQVGSTGPCDTFQNAPLCEEENFGILDLEFWGFLTGVF
jgi:hypothetical protein